MAKYKKKFKTYEEIERSYNSHLERDADLIYLLGSVDQSDSSAQQGAGSGTEAESQNIGDVTLDGSLESALWQPKSAGFSLDARTGYTEFNNAYVQGTVVGYSKLTSGTFGGSAADGVLSSSSGVTTLDAAGARVLVKEYESISLTGTSSLTVSNKHANGTILILKCTGDVTISSTASPVINLVGIGADGGTGGPINTNGSIGLPGFSIPFNITSPAPGDGGTNIVDGAGGVGPYQSYDPQYAFHSRSHMIACGAGGGGGRGGAGGVGGDGGDGGGCLIIECGGTLTMTSATPISVKGAVGGNGVTNGGGGGGGGAGMAFVFYNLFVANTGSIDVDGGLGGTTAGAFSGGGGASMVTDGDLGSSGGGAGGGGIGGVLFNQYFA